MLFSHFLCLRSGLGVMLRALSSVEIGHQLLNDNVETGVLINYEMH